MRAAFPVRIGLWDRQLEKVVRNRNELYHPDAQVSEMRAKEIISDCLSLAEARLPTSSELRRLLSEQAEAAGDSVVSADELAALQDELTEKSQKLAATQSALTHAQAQAAAAQDRQVMAEHERDKAITHRTELDATIQDLQARLDQSVALSADEQLRLRDQHAALEEDRRAARATVRRRTTELTQARTDAEGLEARVVTAEERAYQAQARADRLEAELAKSTGTRRRRVLGPDDSAGSDGHRASAVATSPGHRDPTGPGPRPAVAVRRRTRGMATLQASPFDDAAG